MFPSGYQLSAKTVLALLCVQLSGCVAVSITPPLSGQGERQTVTYQGVTFTSGTFKRAHRVVGVVQMTQEGFRHYLAGEVNEESTQANHMMNALARYAAAHGAHGLQQFSLIDENPRSQEERTAQTVGQTIKILSALGSQDKQGYQSSIQEGEQTRYRIKGELVAWIDPAPPSVNKTSPNLSEPKTSTIPSQESK